MFSSNRFLLLLALYCFPAFALCQDIIPVIVPQYDDRIEVTMRYDRSTRSNKPNLNLSDEYKYTNQRVYITIRNKTQNRIVVYLEYYGEKSCGITTSAGVSDKNGIGTLNPGQSKSHDFNVSLGGLGDTPCNPLRQADGTYSYIRQVGYKLERIWEDKAATASGSQTNNTSYSSVSNAEKSGDQLQVGKLTSQKDATTTQLAKVDNGKTSATSNQSDADFWGNKKTEATGNGGNALPEISKSKDGKYYLKDANNQFIEINQDDYYRIKIAKEKQVQTLTPAQQQAKQEADNQTVDNIMDKVKRDQAANDKIYADVQRNFDLQRQGYAAVAAREESKENLKEITNLAGSYQSVDQLMADFNYKMSQVNNAVSDLTEKRNQAVSSAADYSFNTPELATYNEGIKVIGNIVNSAKEANERKAAREQLEQQKTQMLNRMIAEEKRLLTGIRTDLFSRFKESALPLSSNKVASNTIYYFVYAYNTSQLGDKAAQLYLSNVFPVAQYSDGTWPFKTSITNDIAKLTPLGEVLHGYYTSQQEAEAMQAAMADVFRQTGGSIIPVAYKGKKPATSTGNGGSGDFWETGKKATESTDKKPVKKNDFWNN